MMWHRAKSRAKKNNIPFEITPKDIVIPEICPVLSITLKLNKGGRSGHFPDSPSLDRIDSTRGYTKDNIRVISARANLLKSDGNLQEFEQIVRYLRESSV